MFFSKAKTGKDSKEAPQAKKSNVVGQAAGQGSHSDQIRAQALANARAARERLGDDYIQEMAAILKKHQNRLTPDQAKAQIKATDPERVAIEILEMLDKKDR